LDAIVRRLFQTNPQAFIDGDINRLRKGAVLDLVNATPAAFASVEEPNSHTLEFVKPPPVEWSKLTRTTTGEGNPTVVEELEQKVEEAQWTLHAEQKENTTLKARLARLEERFAALQEKRAELERKEQQLTATLESLAQAETPARPHSAPASAVATTEPSGELAPSVDSGRGAAAAASERPIQAPTPEPRTLLGMTLDTAWTGLLAVLAAVLGIALLWKRRRRQTSTPAPALPRVDNSSQTPTDPPEDVHVAFLDDDAVGLDGLSIDALTNDPLTHDLSLEEEHAQDTLAEIDGEAKVIQTDAGKAQELAEEVGLYMAYGQYDRAKDTIEEAIALDPRDEHKVVLLTVYAALGEHEEAKALTQELLARRESLGDELRVQVEDITRKCA
jgi:pilus assembly protein FimV